MKCLVLILLLLPGSAMAEKYCFVESEKGIGKCKSGDLLLMPIGLAVKFCDFDSQVVTMDRAVFCTYSGDEREQRKEAREVRKPLGNELLTLPDDEILNLDKILSLPE